MGLVLEVLERESQGYKGGAEEASQAGTHLNCVLKKEALGKGGRFQKGGIL